ncbi:MAG: hypothetical protein ACRDF4_02030 [Rhabdochlamydiaceae bacterium]
MMLLKLTEERIAWLKRISDKIARISMYFDGVLSLITIELSRIQSFNWNYNFGGILQINMDLNLEGLSHLVSVGITLIFITFIIFVICENAAKLHSREVKKP